MQLYYMLLNCIFQNSANGNERIVSNLKNLLDIYNIGAVQKSMFGSFVDDLKFFYQLKNQEYKYIYDEVGIHNDKAQHVVYYACA